jgi:uncharacterized protein (DUF2252 family)
VLRFTLLRILLGFGLVGCGSSTIDEARKAEIVNVMTSADEALLRTRPNLVAGKYARMAMNPYDFFRGTVPLSWHDYRNNHFDIGSSSFALDGPLAPVLGDPHPENFGTLLGADGELALEPNDFDSSEFAPYLWDLRRLTTGMALAARMTNPEDPVAHDATAQASRAIARAAAESYAQGILGLSKGNERTRITRAEKDPILEDLFSRAQEGLADRTELMDLTTLDNGRRLLRRGVLDPLDPAERYLDLPPWALAALPNTLHRYRESLVNPPESAYFNVLDAVRVLGSGVASWARVRVVLLVRGPTDDPNDDVLLELKELNDSGLGGHYPPFVHYDDVQERIRETSRAAWARPDGEPLWGTSEWLGFPCQIKLESNAQKTIRVRRMNEERGTPEALESLARHLGAVLARAHTATPKNAEWVARDIAYVITRDPGAFADEQADVGNRYAERVFADHELFRQALEERGPRLGLPPDENDLVAPDLAAIYADEQAW